MMSVLYTRVKKPTGKDTNKLVRMMRFLNFTVEDKLVLSAENGINTIEWHIDASFTLHPDFRSHTGATMMFAGRRGCPISNSSKQKMNTNSSTTSELVAVDQTLLMALWVPLFLGAQGHNIKENIIYQDNMSVILLKKR